MTKTKKILGIVLALIVLTLAMSISIFAQDSENTMLPDGITAESFGDNTVTDGTNFYATLSDAVVAIDNAKLSGAILYCKPEANVGSLQHAPVCSTLTVYGNGATVAAGGNQDFDIGNTDPNGGRDVTADMTLTVYNLNGCGAWGAKATEHTVTVVFEGCKDMGEVFINGTVGTLNISLTNCSFTSNVVSNCKVYSNANGNITLNGVEFSNVDKAVNLNHKAAGTQEVVLTNCTFTNCGNNVTAGTDEIPVRVLSSVEGGYSNLTVGGCEFTGTPEGGADILLDYGVGSTNASVSSTSANVTLEKENNVGSTTVVASTDNKSFSNVEVAYVASVNGFGYETLAEAIAYANTLESATVVVLSDTTLGGTVISGNVTIDLNGCVVTSTADYFFYMAPGSLTVKDTSANKTGTLNGVTTGNAFIMYGNSSLTIEGGTIYTMRNGIFTYYSNNTVVINGGKLETLPNANDATAAFYLCATNSTVTVNGGTILGNINTWGDTIIVNGGSFSVNVGGYCANGYTTKLVDGLYVVVETEKSVFIGETGYYSLEDALNAAKAGDTIEIKAAGTYALKYKSYDEGRYWLPADLTIKGTVDGVVIGNAPAFSASNITIENVDFVNATGSAVVFHTSGTSTFKNCDLIAPNGTHYSTASGTLIFENCAIKGSATYGISVNEGSGSVSLTNCVLAGWNSFGVSGKVTFTNCEFTNEGAYDFVVLYENAEFTNTVFGTEVMVGAGKAEQTFEFTGCSVVDGSSLLNAFDEGFVEEAADVIVDGLSLKVVYVAQIGDVKYATYAEAFAAAKNGDTVVILVAGEFTPTVAQGLTAIQNLDGNYVVGVAPTATVKDYGPTLIPGGEYGIWDGKNYTSKGTEDLPLSFVMQFIADQTAADMANSPYADWYADFVITFDGLENDAIIADGCYLAGYYGDFGWVKIPVDGMKIEEGVRYPVMLGVGLGQKYDYVCSGVKDFKCALYITPEILEANPNLTVNLELAVVDNSKGQNAAAEAMVNGTAYNVTDYDYEAEDFVVNYVAQVGDNKYTSLQAAINAANGGTVVVLENIDIADTTIKIPAGTTVTLDLNGKIISGVCNANQASMFVIENTATLTVKDTATNGKITYAAGQSNVGFEMDVKGSFILESGTIELTGSWSLGFAVDVRPNAWGTAYTAPTSFTMNGGKIASSDTAVRVASNSSSSYAPNNVTFTMNGGVIESGWDAIFVQHLYANNLYVNVKNGSVTGSNSALRIYGDVVSDVYFTVEGGTFVGELKNLEATGNGNTAITGGLFAKEPTIIPEGYAAIQNLDGNYVVGVAPTATVKDYGPTIIAGGDYGIWDGKNYTSTSTADMPLSFVMQFIADQTAADMANSPYADWYADFVITFDGLENDAFIADGCYLAGFYGDFGWVKIPVDGMTIEEGVRYPVMLGVGLGQKYDYVCSGVKDFKCALYITPEILEANPNLTVNLELAVVDNSKGQNAAAEAMVNGTSYNVTDYDYVAEDFQITVATVGEKKFTTLQAAIDYAIANGGKVTLVSSININEGIVINGNVEIDLAGYTVALDSNVANCVFNIENGTVSISNGTISTNNGQAIYAGLDKNTSYAPVVALENVTLDGAEFGLSVFGGANVTIGSGVVISGSVEALRVWNSAQVTVNAGASITCTGNGEVARAIAVYENASVSVTGGTFTGIVDKIAGTLAITGGTFTTDVSAYVAEGYAAIQNLDGNYVVGVAPTATVKDYGPTIIPGGEYGIWDGKNYTSTSTADMPLSFVMQFLADQTAADMANSPYADWYADFVITFDGLENDAFIADGCYLAGFYGDFGWVKIPVDGMTIEEGVRYPVMLGVGLGQKYDYVCSGVKDFKCALYITPEILEANPNLTVNLELAAVDNSKGQDAAAEAMVNGTSYNVTDYDYVAEDFIVDYVAAVGNKQFTSLADAIAYANANGGTVTLLDNIELDAPIVVTGTVTLDLAGYTINYNSTVQGEAMITNKGNLTINDSVGTGVIYYNYTGAADSSYSKGNYTISNAGTLTVNGGKITIANLSGHAKYPIDNNSTTGNAVLVINGGHLYNYNTSAIRQFCNSTVYKNSVTINGGLIEGYSAIWVQNPGSSTVNGDLTVNGGEIKSTAKAYVNGSAALSDVGSAIYFTIAGNGGAWSEGSFVALNGGIFNENVYLAEQAPASITIGEDAIFNGYLELPMVPVASVNGIDFATLAEAIAYANANGGTVKLLDNIALSETIAVTGTVTLDLNGYTITGTDNSTKSFSLFTNKGTFTITGNGAITLVATNNRAWNNYSSVISNTVGGKLIVEGGTIEHLGGTDMAYAIDNLTNGKGTYAETVVNGGLVKSTYRAIRQFLNGTEAQNILTINGGTIEGANKAIFFQDPSANANTGSLTIGENAVVTGGVYLFVTAGSTEWPVEVSIATSALANGANDVTSKNVPEGYLIKEANGVIGVEKIDVPADVQWYDITLSLESDLKINYYLLTSTLYDGYNYYARVIKHHDTGCNDHAECEVHYIPMSKWAIGDTYTRIAVDGIAAKDMACQVEVQIFVGEMPEDYTVKHDSSVTTGATFGPADGSVAVSLTGRMSILQYCKTVFSVSGEGYEQYEAVKPLLADLLLYGKASQEFFGHYITKTAEDGTVTPVYVTDGIEDIVSYYATTPERNVTNQMKWLGGDQNYFWDFTLSLETTTYLNFYFQNLTAEGTGIADFNANKIKAHVTFNHYDGKAHDKVYSVADGTMLIDENGYAVVVIDDLAPADLFDLVHVELFYGEQSLAEFQGSAESYCYIVFANPENAGEALVKLCDAIVALAEEAEEYFTNKSN